MKERKYSVCSEFEANLLLNYKQIDLIWIQIQQALQSTSTNLYLPVIRKKTKIEDTKYEFLYPQFLDCSELEADIQLN